VVWELFGSGAQWIQQVALSWLVYDLTGSGTMLGLINGLRTLPFALTAPFAGVLTDRMDRRRIMLATQVFLAAVSVLFAVDVALGWVKLWHIIVFTLLMGAGGGINNTARQAVVPVLVPRKDLVNAMALSQTSMNITRVFGPAVGGLMIGLIGMAANFFVQAGCYVGAFASLLPIKIPAHAIRQHKEGFFTSMKAGFAYMLENKPVLSLVILGLIPMLFIFPINALMPIFAAEVFGLKAQGFGIMLTVVGVGSLIGTLAMATMGDVKRKSVVLFTLCTLAITATIVFSWTRSLPLALVALGFQGLFQMSYFSLNGAVLQMHIPDNMRGRVMSVYMLDTAMIPLGGTIAGILSDVVGAPWALTAIGGTGLLFVLVAFFALPAVRKL
jgi:MFS family permease